MAHSAALIRPTSGWAASAAQAANEAMALRSDSTSVATSSPASGRASDQGRIDHALHLAALREHSLLSLSELSQNLSASPDLFHMADLVLYNLMGRFGTANAALWLLSSGDRTAVLIRAHGISQSLARADRPRPRTFPPRGAG